MTTGSPPPRLNARGPRNELVRFTSENAYAEVSARYAGGGAAKPAGSGVSRRRALTIVGVGALIAEQALVADEVPPGATAQAQAQAQARIQAQASIPPNPAGYAPDGTAGRTAALPLHNVELLDSPFQANQARNTDYLLFLDPERMLRAFRLNYGQHPTAQPIGGWEKPASQIRGHTTGHLLSAL